MDSIGGFFFGLLLFFITFYVPYSAAKTEKDSVDMNKLSVTPVAEAASLDGKGLVEGNLTAGSTITAPIVDLDKPILAFTYALEENKPHIETRTETYTRTEGGQEVEYTEEVEEEVWEWETLESDQGWAVFKLGTITVDPQQCDIRDLNWASVHSDSYSSADTGNEIREEVKVIYADVQVLLAAEFAGGNIIAEPDFYRLSTGSKEDLVAQVHGEEEASRWFKIILSVVLWTIAFNLMAGPAMILINIIPIKQLSGAIRGVITFVSLILASIITFVTYVFIKYWWVIALLLVVLAVVVVVNAVKHKDEDLDLDAELDDMDPEPEDGT